MDVDFSNRSVLKIITNCGLEPLLAESDPKAENLLNCLFVGKESNLCDGDISGYSNFYHILTEETEAADTQFHKHGDFTAIVNQNF